MAKSCRRIVPSLYRVAEGEAAPDEALRVARHLGDCTACRIVLARVRRLAAMLDQGLDDPPAVGDEFVATVMDNLPQGPPPAARRRGRTRARLAGWGPAGTSIALALVAIGGTGLGLRSGLGLPPRLAVADVVADGAPRLGWLLVLGFERLACDGGLPGGLPLAGPPLLSALAALLLAAGLGSAGALAAALTFGGWLRPPTGST